MLDLPIGKVAPRRFGRILQRMRDAGPQSHAIHTPSPSTPLSGLTAGAMLLEEGVEGHE